MAEASNNESEELKKVSKEELECAVCLQTCVHPAQLPCGHIFCYLCVKGIANQSKKCAMCRQEIPRDFIEQPHLLTTPSPETDKGFDEGYQWFYEGRNGWWQYSARDSEDIENAYKLKQNVHEILICGQLYIIDLVNYLQYPKIHPSRKRSIKREIIQNLNVKGIAGWWQYDERTSKELESMYKAGEKSCELLIAGFLYIVDLENMIQLRRNDPSRRRSIKRDLASVPKKGIAGIRTDSNYSNELDNSNVHVFEHRPENSVPITPTNTPQSPSGRESPEVTNILERFNNLRLNSTNLNFNVYLNSNTEPENINNSQ